MSETAGSEDTQIQSDCTQVPESDGHDEHFRLGGRPPLKTIFALAFGPVLSQFSSALYGIIDSMWVSKTKGTDGLTAISTYAPFDNMGRAFGFFCTIAASSKSSALFGQKKADEIPQLFCDLLRVALICGCFVPAILLPFVKDAARWFGASERIVDMGFDYITVLLACSFSTCVYLCVNGFLQGEGRSLLVGIANVISMLLNSILFDPVLLKYTNLGVKAAAIATVLSELIPALILLTCYFLGKFSIKPELKMMFRKFGPNLLPSLKVGLSQLIAQLAMSVPSIFIQKWTGDATSTEADYNGAMAGNNIVFRYAMITMSIVIAVNMGYLPPGSYAYASHQVKRWKLLTIHAAWINFVWGTICCIVAWALPRQVCRLFSDDDEFLGWAAPMLQYGNAGAAISWIKNNAQSCLQGMQRGMLATIMSVFTQLLSLIGFAALFHFTAPHDARRIQWAYPASFLFGMVISFFVLFKPIKDFLNSEQQVEEMENLPENELHELDKIEAIDSDHGYDDNTGELPV